MQLQKTQRYLEALRVSSVKKKTKKKATRTPPRAPAARKLKKSYTLADVHRHCGADLIEPLEETRQVIFETIPNIEERVYDKGRGIGYHVPGVGVRFGIFFAKHSVALVLPYADLLPEPEGLVDGRHKKSRWVNIRPGQPLKREALSRLLLAALME